jgi:hypothetical protein
MNAILTIYHAIPGDAWAAVGAAILSIGIVQKAKKWISSERVIMTLLTALSALAGAVPYFLSSAAAHPTILGQYTLTMVGLSTLLYKYGKLIPIFIAWLKRDKTPAPSAATAAPEATPATVVKAAESTARSSVFSV